MIETALEYLDAPWHHQGRGPDGIDCVGLLTVPLRQHNWEPNQTETLNNAYLRLADGEHILNFLRGEGRELTDISELIKGDVIAFHYQSDPFAQHVGWVTRKREDGTIYVLHASNVVGKVVQHRFSLEWRKRFRAGFRLAAFEVNNG